HLAAGERVLRRHRLQLLEDQCETDRVVRVLAGQICDAREVPGLLLRGADQISAERGGVCHRVPSVLRSLRLRDPRSGDRGHVLVVSWKPDQPLGFKLGSSWWDSRMTKDRCRGGLVEWIP